MSTIKIVGALLILSLWGAVAHAGTVTYIYTDPQGTPLAEADATGTITARFDYAPYGVASTASGMSGAPNGPGYTGHVNDPDTGLVYMQARYYDPAVGRFLSVDPVRIGASYESSINLYSYANNNPIAATDPTGAYAQGLSGEQIECEIYHTNCSSGGAERTQLASRATHAANIALQSGGVLGKSYTVLNDLLSAWSDAVVPVTAKLHVEIGSDLMHASDGGYLSSPAYSTGDRNTIMTNELPDNTLNERGKFAEIHTHPSNKDFSGMTAYAIAGHFSAVNSGDHGSGDLVRYFNMQIDGYVALSNGAVHGWKHQPFTNDLNQIGGYKYQNLSNAVFTVRGPTH